MISRFEDGQRVRYMGMRGPGTEWYGRAGVVKESYRDFDGERTLVLLDGESKAWSFDVDQLEPVKEIYLIEAFGEDSTTAVMELDDVELALIRRLVDKLNDNRTVYAPNLTITKWEEK